VPKETLYFFSGPVVLLRSIVFSGFEDFPVSGLVYNFSRRGLSAMNIVIRGIESQTHPLPSLCIHVFELVSLRLIGVISLSLLLEDSVWWGLFFGWYNIYFYLQVFCSFSLIYCGVPWRSILRKSIPPSLFFKQCPSGHPLCCAV